MAALTHSAQLFNVDTHGATLTKEVITTVKDVIEAIRALVQTFLALQIDAGSGTGTAGEEYMVRTGAVHDLIDKSRGAKGLSKDNLEAVRKKWTENRGALEDGFREVGEMIEEAEGSDGDDDEDDGGWDELGLGKGTKMTPDELERTKKVWKDITPTLFLYSPVDIQVHGLLRLTTLLHKRILLDLLDTPAPLSSGISAIPNTSFDTLLFTSTALLAASDDLVSTLYTSQDPLAIRTEIISFIDVVRSLQSNLLVFFPIEAQLSEMNIGLEKRTNGNEIAKKGGRKWFDTCFEQIYKLSTTFASTLHDHNTDHEP